MTEPISMDDWERSEPGRPPPIEATDVSVQPRFGVVADPLMRDQHPTIALALSYRDLLILRRALVGPMGRVEQAELDHRLWQAQDTLMNVLPPDQAMAVHDQAHSTVPQPVPGLVT